MPVYTSDYALTLRKTRFTSVPLSRYLIEVRVRYLGATQKYVLRYLEGASIEVFQISYERWLIITQRTEKPFRLWVIGFRLGQQVLNKVFGKKDVVGLLGKSGLSYKTHTLIRRLLPELPKYRR